MKIKNIKIFLPLFVISVISLNNTSYASNADTTKASKGISICYIPNGLQLGLENYYFQNAKYKIIGSASLLFQRFPSYYTSAGLVVSSILRKTGKFGLYFEQGIKFGYLGSYYDFDMYKVKSDGSIVNIGRTWRSSVILGYSVGFGYDFSKKTKANLQLFFKPGLYYRFPNNDNVFYLNNYSIEIGLILHPKWFK